MLNLVRINFDKQSRERKYPPTINERRTMLKGMIGNATMFDSLANSIKQVTFLSIYYAEFYGQSNSILSGTFGS
jgi:hypothetical protein